MAVVRSMEFYPKSEVKIEEELEMIRDAVYWYKGFRVSVQRPKRVACTSHWPFTVP